MYLMYLSMACIPHSPTPLVGWGNSGDLTIVIRQSTISRTPPPQVLLHLSIIKNHVNFTYSWGETPVNCPVWHRSGVVLLTDT